MKNINILVFLILGIIFFISGNEVAYSQDEFDPGSAYTALGVGEMQYSSSMRTDAMGIQGVSLLGNYINRFNPAANANLSFTNISVGAKFGFLKTANSTTNSTSSTGSVSGIDIGIPFNHRLGWVFNLGFSPISQVSYKIVNDVNSGGVPYKQTYAGNGGISRINAGMTYKLFGGVNIGFQYNYSFGNFVRSKVLDFNTVYIQNTNIRNETDTRGSFINTGFVFDIGKLYKSKIPDDFTFGFAYQSKMSLSANLDGIYGTSIGVDTAQSSAATIDVPECFSLGFTKKIGKQTILSTDFLYQDWSKNSNAGLSFVQYKNFYRIGLGIEILPMPKFDKSFFESLTYRLGAYYDKAFYVIGGQEVNRIGFTAGIQIPVSSNNSVDLGLSYFMRGNTDNNLIKDQFLRLSASINFGELWFIKTRED